MPKVKAESKTAPATTSKMSASNYVPTTVRKPRGNTKTADKAYIADPQENETRVSTGFSRKRRRPTIPNDMDSNIELPYNMGRIQTILPQYGKSSYDTQSKQ